MCQLAIAPVFKGLSACCEVALTDQLHRYAAACALMVRIRLEIDSEKRR